MTTSLFVLSLVMSAADGGVNHGIYGGFNPQWVCPAYSGTLSFNSLVTLTVGAAVVDGEQTYAQGMALYPFPDDIPGIVPKVPDFAIGHSLVAYCYVADVNGGGAGSAWFAASSPSNHPFDFICGATVPGVVDWSPTPDGHPHSPLPYGGGGFTTSHAIFVGSVVGRNARPGDTSCGGSAVATSPFEVLPFYRNGSEVIYDTATSCALTYSADAGYNTSDGGLDGGPWCGQLIGLSTNEWDLGIPSWAINQTTHGDVPLYQQFDFTHDGINDTLPLSASQIILDSEAEGGNEPDAPTLCFMNPNIPFIDPVSEARSCQSEVMIDAPGPIMNNYRPVTPFRTRLNIGDAGTGYGVIWVGGAGAPGQAGIQLYFDLSYRGYVEPERQLVPQISLH